MFIYKQWLQILNHSAHSNYYIITKVWFSGKYLLNPKIMYIQEFMWEKVVSVLKSNIFQSMLVYILYTCKIIHIMRIKEPKN